jgi:hypothetical protein
VSQRGHGHHFQGDPKNLAHKVLDFRLTFGGETAAVVCSAQIAVM